MAPRASERPSAAAAILSRDVLYYRSMFRSRMGRLGHRSKTWHHRCVRVHRSFAFVDVSGFTALTEREGDEHAVEVLTSFRTLLREICARRGVRIAKWLGDGVMLVCVETPPLLATILELHHVVHTVPSPAHTVSIRSGVTSGDVILMEGDDYIGHCVNVAARLCDLGHGGEALAAPSVMGDMPRWGVVLSERDVALRGVERPIVASSIGMLATSEGGGVDPICGVPLSPSTAEETALDQQGRTVLFCSPGCQDTWSRRPAQLALVCGTEGGSRRPARRRAVAVWFRNGLAAFSRDSVRWLSLVVDPDAECREHGQRDGEDLA